MAERSLKRRKSSTQPTNFRWHTLNHLLNCCPFDDVFAIWFEKYVNFAIAIIWNFQQMQVVLPSSLEIEHTSNINLTFTKPQQTPSPAILHCFNAGTKSNSIFSSIMNAPLVETSFLESTQILWRWYQTLQSPNYERYPLGKCKCGQTNNSHPTGVVKRVYGHRSFPLTTKAV